MNKRISLLVASAVFLACFGLTRMAAQKPTPTPPPAPASPTRAAAAEEQPFPPNVRVDVTIVDQPGAGGPPVRKSMSVTVVAARGARNTAVRSGVSMPMVQTTLGAAASGGLNTIPITTYNYRTMGLNLDVRDAEVRGDRVRLYLMVEYSPLEENEKRGAPVTTPVSYSNFSQSFELVLDNGKPMVVAQTSDPVPSRNRTLSVEVKATILK